MELIVDTNVLLAAILKEAVSRELLLDSRLKLYAPERLLSETQKHLKPGAELRKRLRCPSPYLEQFFILLTEHIEIVAESEFASRLTEAVSIAPHEEDAPYIALGLAFCVPIWSNDSGMKSQSKVPVYSTHELIKILEKRGD